MKYITGILILILWMVWHLSIDSQTVMTREEAIDSGVFHIGSVRAQLLRYRNEVLAQKNFRLSYLPAVSLTISPVNFNHSMRLLQNPFDGDYYNVNDYSNTTTGGVTVSQKIGLTGGTFVLSSSLSLLREFSHHTTGISSVPLYAGYQQPLWGGGRSYRFEKEIQDLKTSYALKQLCSTIAHAQQEVSALFLQAYVQQMECALAHHTVVMGDSLLTIASLRKQKDLITQADYEQVECQHLQNRMDWVKARRAWDETLYQLKDLVGCDSFSVVEPTYASLPQSLSDGDVWAQTLQNNPFVLSQNIQEREAAKTVFDTKRETRFNADIAVSYGLNQYASDLAKAYHHPDQSQSISIAFRIPVFQWGLNRNKRAMAANEYEALQTEQTQAFDDFSRTIHSAVFKYNYARELIGVAHRRYRLSVRQYDYAVAKFRYGKISAMDLTKANQEQFSTLREYAEILEELYDSYYTVRSLSLYDAVLQKNLEEIIHV